LGAFCRMRRTLSLRLPAGRWCAFSRELVRVLPYACEAFLRPLVSLIPIPGRCSPISATPFLFLSSRISPSLVSLSLVSTYAFSRLAFSHLSSFSAHLSSFSAHLSSFSHLCYISPMCLPPTPMHLLLLLLTVVSPPLLSLLCSLSLSLLPHTHTHTHTHTPPPPPPVCIKT
jgi:hypothetical protein